MTLHATPKPALHYWLFWLVGFYSVWFYLVLVKGLWPVALDHWPMAFAMALGSYAAGSTPMGGGTVGFPVLVLLFELPASLGRDFSFAVQSIGMTSAAIFILTRRQPLATAMLAGAIVGSTIGTPLGVLYIAPLLSEIWIKLVFAVMWASFGFLHLYRLNEIASHTGMTDFDERWDFKAGLCIGLLAGSTVSAVSGVGIDMMLYTALVLLCRADLKIAIPTSVIIMAYTSVIGVMVKVFLSHEGLQPGVFENWLAAAPVVAVGAPLGVYIVAKIGRKPTLLIVAGLCVVQFVWTLQSEYSRLGIIGCLLAFLAVGLFLLVFESLRAWGNRLVSQRKQQR